MTGSGATAAGSAVVIKNEAPLLSAPDALEGRLSLLQVVPVAIGLAQLEPERLVKCRRGQWAGFHTG